MRSVARNTVYLASFAGKTGGKMGGEGKGNTSEDKS